VGGEGGRSVREVGMKFERLRVLMKFRRVQVVC